MRSHQGVSLFLFHRGVALPAPVTRLSTSPGKRRWLPLGTQVDDRTEEKKKIK